MRKRMKFVLFNLLAKVKDTYCRLFYDNNLRIRLSKYTYYYLNCINLFP